MYIGSRDDAEKLLRTLSYYRLSGYWFPLRQFHSETKTNLDTFRDGSSFELVHSLYKFDEKLRTAIFHEISRIELAMRGMLGHALGRIHPLVHLDVHKLGASAAQKSRPRKDRTVHDLWIENFQKALNKSKEDFVTHHKIKYNGKLPIWAAVEVMDWGMLSHLYSMSPARAKEEVASACGLRAPQLASWLKSLNIVRNYAAHHARMFNRVYDIKPKLSKDPRLCSLKHTNNRLFGQLTLIQYLHHELQLSPANVLPELLLRFPHNPHVPFSRTGAPEKWHELELWKLEPKCE